MRLRNPDFISYSDIIRREAAAGPGSKWGHIRAIA